MDRVGIPNAHVCAFTSISQDVGANRIVYGGHFTAPLGNSEMTPEAEKTYRRKIVDKALEVLQMNIEKPTIFTVDESKGEEG